MKIKVVGLDPSLSNWGICHATLDIDTLAIGVSHFQLIETVPEDSKQTRKNSDDLRRAMALHAGMRDGVKGAVAAFCEAPVGSQSARAMASYGICVGVLGACTVPLIEVTPFEVKLAAVNHKYAAKQEMIDWGLRTYPQAPWIRRAGKPTLKNEHLADATAAIHAGIKTAQFQAVLQVLRAQQGVAA